jgi:uncharacterized phiE125 gp8 family phage protein
MTVRTEDSFISCADAPAVTVEYAKAHIQSLSDSEDFLIETFIEAATSYFEEQTGRQVRTTTRELWLDAFPFIGSSGGDARIELPHPPLVSVVSVKYIDTSGVLQSFVGGSPSANLYRISAPAGQFAARGFVEPIYGGVWPTARAESGAVRIQYTCGYGSAAVPALVTGILCYLVGHFDQFRSAVVEASNGQLTTLPYGVQAMMDGFKYSALPSQRLMTGLESTF